ncbi:MAG: hypothetical protein AAFY81_06615, partial [Pseudomonadota bacterium]
MRRPSVSPKLVSCAREMSSDQASLDSCEPEAICDGSYAFNSYLNSLSDEDDLETLTDFLCACDFFSYGFDVFS